MVRRNNGGSDICKPDFTLLCCRQKKRSGIMAKRRYSNNKGTTSNGKKSVQRTQDNKSRRKKNYSSYYYMYTYRHLLYNEDGYDDCTTMPNVQKMQPGDIDRYDANDSISTRDPYDSLRNAINRGSDIVCIGRILDDNPYLLDFAERFPSDETPLHTACGTVKRGNCTRITSTLDVVSYIYNRCPRAIRNGAWGGMIPLSCVINTDDSNTIDLVQFLISCHQKDVHTYANPVVDGESMYIRTRSEKEKWHLMHVVCAFHPGTRLLRYFIDRYPHSLRAKTIVVPREEESHHNQQQYCGTFYENDDYSFGEGLLPLHMRARTCIHRRLNPEDEFSILINANPFALLDRNNSKNQTPGQLCSKYMDDHKRYLQASEDRLVTFLRDTLGNTIEKHGVPEIVCFQIWHFMVPAYIPFSPIVAQPLLSTGSGTDLATDLATDYDTSPDTSPGVDSDGIMAVINPVIDTITNTKITSTKSDASSIMMDDNMTTSSIELNEDLMDDDNITEISAASSSSSGNEIIESSNGNETDTAIITNDIIQPPTTPSINSATDSATDYVTDYDTSPDSTSPGVDTDDIMAVIIPVINPIPNRISNTNITATTTTTSETSIVMDDNMTALSIELNENLIMNGENITEISAAGSSSGNETTARSNGNATDSTNVTNAIIQPPTTPSINVVVDDSSNNIHSSSSTTHTHQHYTYSAVITITIGVISAIVAAMFFMKF